MKNAGSVQEHSANSTEYMIHKPVAGSNVLVELSKDEPSSFNFAVEDIRAMKLLSDGGMLISFNDGSTLTITNFQEAKEHFTFTDIAMSDGTVMNLQKVAVGLAGTLPHDSVADLTINKPQGDATFALAEDKTYKLAFDMKDVTGVEEKDGNMVVTFKDGSHLTLTNYEAVEHGVLPPKMTLADGSVIPASQLINVLNVAAADQVKTVEPAAGESTEHHDAAKHAAEPKKIVAAEQLAQIEPAAGGAAGPIGGTAGYGFNSSVDPAGIIGIPAIGPIGPTDLSFGLPQLLDVATIITPLAGPAPLPFAPPILTLSDQFTFEDTAVSLNISAAGTNPSDEILTITVSGIPAGWSVNIPASGGVFNAGTGTWTITLAQGQSYNGGPVLNPPHDSDGDIRLPTHPALSVTVSSTEVSSGNTFSSNGSMNVTVDAVADQPDLAVTNVSGSDNVPLPLHIVAAVTDTDGSETLTTATLTGIPAGFTLNHGTLAGGVWTVQASDLAALTLTAPPGFNGSFVVTVRVNNAETNLTDAEITLTNNTNFNTEAFLVTFNDTTPVVGDSVATVDDTTLSGGNNVATGNVSINYQLDTPGTFTPTSTFSATGNVAGGTLQSHGVPVVVTLTGNTYTGVAGGVTVFTLLVNANGSYTFTQFEQLDHSDTTNANESLSLNFTVQGTDSDGDTDTGVITINVLDDGPIAVNDSFATGTVVTGNVTSNDTMSQDTPNTITQVVFNGTTFAVPTNGTNATIVGAHGTLVINNTGAYTYTSSNTTLGTDNFVYTLKDFDGDTSTATLAATVNDLDAIPQIDNISSTVDETSLNTATIIATGTVPANFFVDTPGTIAPLNTFTAGGSLAGGALTSHGGAVTVTLSGNTYTGTANGGTIFTLVVNANGTYTYTQTHALDHADGTNPNDVITLNFTVQGTDSDGDTDTGIITINVRDDAPIAVDDSFLSSSATASGNIMSNDIVGQDITGRVHDVTFGGTTQNLPSDGTNVTITNAAGTLVINSTGAFTFTPPLPGQGTTFTYHLIDFDNDISQAGGVGQTGTVTIDTDGTPVIGDSTIVTDETTLISGPAVTTGTVSSNYFGDGPGSITALNTFTSGGSLLGGNLTSHGSAVTVTLAGNTYTGKDALNNTVFTLAVSANGDYTFTQFHQLDHANGSDPNDIISLNFTVRGTDADGDTDTGVITVNVRDDAPSALNDTVNMSNNVATGNVLTNDTPGQDTPVPVESVTFGGVTTILPTNGTNATIVGAHGTLVINNTGAYTYTSSSIGTDNFSYTIRDYDGDASSANLSVTVTGIDTVPVIGDSTVTVDETNLSAGPNIASGSVPANYFLDTPGSLVPLNTFNAGGSLAGGSLQSHGVAVNVSLSGNTYTGVAGGVTIFTLLVNANGTYTFTQYEQLDHADATNPNDVITLNFTVRGTDVDGDTDTGVITVNVLDDAPIAVNDSFLSSTATASGNILTNDIPGQDTPVRVADVTFGGVTQNLPSNGTDITITNAAGTLIINSTGAFTYTPPLPGQGTTFTYHIIDYDNDLSQAGGVGQTGTVTVDTDGTPTVTNTTNTVSEGGSHTATGVVTGNFFGDGPGTFVTCGAFSATGSMTAGNLTSGGVAVILTNTGHGYVGTAGGVTVFTLDVANNGSYTFNLLKPLDHADTTNPNDIINLNFEVCAVDADGDVGHGTLTINVIDGAPTASPDAITYCSEDWFHNGNLVTGFNPQVGGSHPADGLSFDTPNSVYAVSGVNGVHNISANSATVVEGNYGRLYVFADGTYFYYARTDAAHTDSFTYYLKDGDGDTSAANITLVGQVGYGHNSSIIVANGSGTGTAGNDVIASYTGDLNDTLFGGDGNDVVKGWTGNDQLHGGNGNDVLLGEYGQDDLWGDAGADVFVADPYDFAGDYAGKFADTVHDFHAEEGDVIDLSALITSDSAAQASINSYVRALAVSGQTMLQVNNNDGTGWHDAMAVTNHSTLDVLALLNSGNLVV